LLVLPGLTEVLSGRCSCQGDQLMDDSAAAAGCALNALTTAHANAVPKTPTER
jgi:hypothetical protein